MPASELVDSSERSASYLWVSSAGSHLKVSPAAYQLLRRVASGASFESIAHALSERQGSPVSAAEVEAAHRKLAEQIAEVDARWGRSPTGYLFRLRLVPERLVGPLAGPLRVLYRPVPACVLLAAAALGLWVAVRDGLDLGHSAQDYWLGYGLFVASLAIHELGHVSASARFGAPPGEIGFGLYWIFPVFYSDVSAAWGLKRKQRIVVDLAGLYLQGGVAAVYALAFVLTEQPAFKLAIVMMLYSAAFMLNPLLKFDGHWVLTDALGVVNLSRQGRRLRWYLWRRVHGTTTDPLPWPNGIAAAVALYTVLSGLFWVYFVWRLAPLLEAIARNYPTLLSNVLDEVRADGHLPGATLVLTLLFSTYLLASGGFMCFSLVRPLAGPLRSLVRRA